jgi:hypothetical protein
MDCSRLDILPSSAAAMSMPAVCDRSCQILVYKLDEQLFFLSSFHHHEGGCEYVDIFSAATLNSEFHEGCTMLSSTSAIAGPSKAMAKGVNPKTRSRRSTEATSSE